MSDHRDGYRLINALFPVFEKLPARQQAVFIQLMGGPESEEGRLSEDPALAEESEEAREHFRMKLKSMRPHS